MQLCAARLTSVITLALTLLGCGREAAQLAMISANEYAIEEARAFQAKLVETDSCPKSFKDWQSRKSEVSGRYSTIKRFGESEFHMSLSCSPELEFSLRVKYSFDSGTAIEGSADGPISIAFGHFTDLKILDVPNNAAAEKIAEEVVKGW